MKLTTPRVTSVASLLGLVVGASIAVERAQRETPAAEPTPKLPPFPDLQTSIDLGNATYLAALQNSDARAYASVFADDALQMPARGEIIRGKTAIAGAIAETFERVSFVGGSIKTMETRLAGTTAFEIGAYTFSLRDRTQTRRRKKPPPQTITGRYLVVWKLTRGEWKIAADFGQPGAPAA